MTEETEEKRPLKVRQYPPFLFGLVAGSTVTGTDAVYRGGYPTLLNFPFLRILNLGTLISILPLKKVSADLPMFCQENNIKWKLFNEDHFNVVEVVKIILNTRNLPVYVHCMNGGKYTGKVIMCLRKIQKWNEVAILDELVRFSKKEKVSEQDETLLTEFKEEDVLNGSYDKPAWLETEYLSSEDSMDEEQQ